MPLFNVGDVVSFGKDHELGVIFDSTLSQSALSQAWRNTTGLPLYQHKVQLLSRPKQTSYYKVFCPGLFLVERPTPSERKAAALALQLATERLSHVKDIKSKRRSNKVESAIRHMKANCLKPGHAVLVRGPKGEDWSTKLSGVDYTNGRVHIQWRWVSAHAIIRTLEAIESELPCELSENTLDQLQDNSWAQFQTGRDFLRKMYIVAFTRDAAASNGDKPSSEVFLDPSLGLYWRPVT